MGILQIQNISLAFGDRDILKDVSFTLDEKSRAALTGANGCGKSTLLKVLTGKIAGDTVAVSRTKNLRVSYLPQSDIVFPDISVYAAAESGLDRFLPMIEEQKRLGEELATAGHDENYIAKASRMAQIDEELHSSGYYDRRRTIECILSGLGFKPSDFDSPCAIFSGGWQMRIALAKILTENPDILLLDEPTNYLDIEATTWLKNYLSAFSGGVMLVSHDQDFLDSTINTVYELFHGKLTRYAGNYTSYLKTREEEIAALVKAYKKQSEEIEKTEEFIERFRYKATKAKQVQSRVKALEKVERIEIPENLKKLSFTFPPAPHSGNEVMNIEHLYKAYGSHVIFNDLSFIVKKGERLAITGRNGAGKSTLLRMLAGAEAGYDGVLRDGAGVKKGYFAQDNETGLTKGNTVLEEIEGVADTKDLPAVRSLLGAFLFTGDDVFKTVDVLSGGEKSRLSLLKILLHPANLLLLDEPTNHLDINSKEMLLNAIKAYGGTVIFVSHDKHFIKNLATRILYLSEEGPEFFEGDYDYFSYKLEEKEARFALEKKPEKAAESASALSYEEQKKARNRQKAEQREVEKLFEKIEAAEEKLKALDAEINKSENYTDAKKITALLKEKEAVEAEKEEMEMLWLEKSEALGV
jgi:ATPase components of ABC transporters with duplicated ATPase domains